MTSSEETERQADTASELLASPELGRMVGTDEFKAFLDHVPVPVMISRKVGDRHRIVYVNAAYERLSGQSAAAAQGETWDILHQFVSTTDESETLAQAVRTGEDFLGVFHRRGETDSRVVQAYVSQIEKEEGGENYRIVALVDIGDKEAPHRAEFESQVRQKDLLLKEIQHRVKNNLQLITAMVRLEARAARRGEQVDLDRLAGRVESLALLYRALEPGGETGELDLGHYVGQIATAAMASHAEDGILLELAVAFCPVSLNVAMPVGLLVNEMFTNAFKYAFPDSAPGKVFLSCERDGVDRFRVRFAHDGRGLPAGVEWPVPGKLSALILQTLRENTIQAEFAVVSEPQGGFEAVLRFAHKALSPVN